MDDKPAKTTPAPPVNPAGRPDAEASGVALDRPTAVLRIGLIALVALAVGALGFRQSKSLPKLPGFSFFAGSGKPDLSLLPDDFPLLPDDVALSSDPVRINGREVHSVRFTSERSPRDVLTEYARILAPRGYAILPAQGSAASRFGRFVGFTGPGQAMLAFRDPRGRFMGIVTFENEATGGSDYLVTLDLEPGDESTPASGDVDGLDPPGVPRPPSAIREYCIENRGARPSVLSLYRSDASEAMVSRLYRARMGEKGWRERPGSKEAFRRSPGGRHLLFVRGTEQCLVNVIPAEEEDGTWVTLAYRTGTR